MIKSNLSKYFSDQDALDSISVTEIENLIAEAPSSDLYRLLLASKMNGLNIHEAALTSSDRLLLEDIVNGRNQEVYTNPIQKNGVLNHTVGIPVFQEEILIEQEVPTTLTEVVDNPETLIVEEKIIEDADKSVEPLPKEPESEVIAEIVLEKQSESKMPSKRKTKKSKNKKFKLDEYSGLSEYALWLMSFEKDDIEKTLKKEAKRAKNRLLEESARKSVTKSEEIISDSLAQILESQGHLDDAKKMYEQLMHKYPEKSIYFAAKIDKLLK